MFEFFFLISRWATRPEDFFQMGQTKICAKDIKEPRYYDLCQKLRAWTGQKPCTKLGGLGPWLKPWSQAVEGGKSAKKVNCLDHHLLLLIWLKKGCRKRLGSLSSMTLGLMATVSDHRSMDRFTGLNVICPLARARVLDWSARVIQKKLPSSSGKSFWLRSHMGLTR